jgi:hypothetical protein
MRDDEQHRHRCEVRALLRWRVVEGSEWVRRWLFGYTDDEGKRVRGVAQARGKAAAERIHRDAAEQWAKGSRGQPGDWRE